MSTDWMYSDSPSLQSLQVEVRICLPLPSLPTEWVTRQRRQSLDFINDQSNVSMPCEDIRMCFA